MSPPAQDVFNEVRSRPVKWEQAVVISSGVSEHRHVQDGVPTNVAGMNLVTGCSKGFFFFFLTILTRTLAY